MDLQVADAAWRGLRDFVMGSELQPHGFCLAWEPGLLSWTILGDLLTAGAYFTIPAMLLIGLRRNKIEVPGELVTVFAAFILFCGIAHLLMVWTLYHPAYRLEAVWKVATALVSVLAAVMLPLVRPRSRAAVEWWRTARALRHENANLKMRINHLRHRLGLPETEWAEIPLPEAPEHD